MDFHCLYDYIVRDMIEMFFLEMAAAKKLNDPAMHQARNA